MTTYIKIAPLNATSIYAVASDNKLYYYNGSSWSLKSSTAILDISITSSGVLYGILTSSNLLVKWSGTAWGSSIGTQTIKKISAKSFNAIYAVGTDDLPYLWNGSYWKQLDGRTVSDITSSKL